VLEEANSWSVVLYGPVVVGGGPGGKSVGCKTEGVNVCKIRVAANEPTLGSAALQR